MHCLIHRSVYVEHHPIDFVTDAVWPLAVMSLLFVLVPSLTSSISFMILPSGALAIGIAYLKFKKTRRGA